MEVCLVKLDEKVPVDSDYRPYRMGMLADALLRRGHSVRRWCSDFDHLRQEPRYGKRCSKEVESGYVLEFIASSLSYKKGAMARRLLNNSLLENQFSREARLSRRPDVIVCSMPTPGMAAASAKLARFFDSPLVVDARDLWPDVIAAELNGVKRLLAKPFLAKMGRELRYACNEAKSLVGITQYYLEHLLSYSGRGETGLDGVFPLGFDRCLVNSPGDDEKARRSLEALGFDFEADTVVYFAGRLNRTVLNAFDPVVEAAQELERSSGKLKIAICGSGSCETEIRKRSARVSNIVFPGELSHKQLAFLRGVSLAGLLPVERRTDYQNSLSNKFFEYLSSGLPILSWLDGLPGQTIVAHGCGSIYQSGGELADQIIDLANDTRKRESFSKSAADLFLSKFEATRVYDSFVDHLEKVAGKIEG